MADFLPLLIKTLNWVDDINRNFSPQPNFFCGNCIKFIANLLSLTLSVLTQNNKSRSWVFGWYFMSYVQLESVLNYNLLLGITIIYY